MSDPSDTAPIEYSETLGRRTRVGTWEDLSVSTYQKVEQAVLAGQRSVAARLGQCFADEAEVIYAIYRGFIPDLYAHLRAKGVDEDELGRIDARIFELIRLPDGTPFDARREWARFRVQAEEFTRCAYAEPSGRALEALSAMKETWRRTHDRDVDHTYGLIQAIVDRFGEREIGPMWDRVLLPLFSWRYEKFDIDKSRWEQSLHTLMLVACEAMRGHLVGPERTGDMELIELDDRYVLRFDACGSGHRTIRGDWIEGTPPRMEPPYGWGVSDEPHTWNHFTKGVCHYCTHCMYLMEEMPIDRFGYPLRVVNPPTYPDTDRNPAKRQRCEWLMFKDPTQVPAEYYQRVGRTKPERFGSRAQGAAPLAPVVSGMPGAG